jgi:DNA-binding SARP family transcriptional activator
MKNFKSFKEWVLLEKEYQDSSMKALVNLNNALNLKLNIEEPESRIIKLATLEDAKERLKTNTMYKNLDQDKKEQIEELFADTKSTIMDLARVFG